MCLFRYISLQFVYSKPCHSNVTKLKPCNHRHVFFSHLHLRLTRQIYLIPPSSPLHFFSITPPLLSLVPTNPSSPCRPQQQATRPMVVAAHPCPRVGAESSSTRRFERLGLRFDQEHGVVPWAVALSEADMVRQR